ncbi:hypothetical protein TruAng_002452 [Truncatella angustata]|nr:hypothetical protein TruAng_002452 [Truncatella angustata]
MSQLRHFSLYNGISERSRGWKQKRSEKITEEHPRSLGTMRWDGAARSSSRWDCLRRDPELWYRDGDCYVHLYGRGQSRRGPAFKVSFSALLEANCYPLLDRFTTNEVSEIASSSETAPDHAHYARMSNQPRIELYIPAPPGSDKQQAYKYHIKTRNFFAFVFRRSLVGEYLGEALENLRQSVQEFRAADADNMADLMGYMDEEGYLDMKNQPTHALAVIRFAEAFQIHDLYVEAFAHCCGMSNRLFLSPEYQLISSVTRKLLRQALLETDVKLGQICLHSGGRAHLERFRTLLHGFYAAKFGYYPPPSIHPSTTIFEVDILRELRDDFEALYQYLVDETFDPSQGVLPSAQGGICALQSVQAFDARSKFMNLSHPFPLLPNVRSQSSLKRMTWFGKHSKLSTTQKTEHHVALLRATNEINIELLDNDLVRAYRRFEEDSIYSPIKGDKQEQLNLIDARKVRWILVYAMYQTLRQVTQVPIEVKDSAGAPYNLCISTTNIPPWKEDALMPLSVSKQLDRVPRNFSISTDGQSTDSEPQRTIIPTSFDIKPDIDYLGLLQKDESVNIEGSAPSPIVPVSPARRASIKKGLSRHRTFRRSLRLFSNHEIANPPSPVKRQSQQYHEIVVLGYGNGTHDVEFNLTDDENGIALTVSEIKNSSTASRSASTASSMSDSTSGSASENGSALTLDTSLSDSMANSPSKPTKADPWESLRSNSLRVRGQNTEYSTKRAMSMCSGSRPPALLFSTEKPNDICTKSIKPQRSRSLLDRYRKSLEPAPLKVRRMPSVNFEDDDHNLSNGSDTINENIWEDVDMFIQSPAKSLQTDVNWDHYNDLGGLTDLSKIHPKRASTMF